MPIPDIIHVRFARHNTGGRSGQHIASIARSTLVHFSKHANYWFSQKPYNSVFGVSTGAPEETVCLVLNWMTEQAAARESVPLPCPETFEDATWVLQLCHSMGVHYRFSDGIKEALIEYVKSAPLTVAEFAMVHEVLQTQTTLKRLVVAETEKRYKAGGEVWVPDWNEIGKYCVEMRIEIDDGADEAVVQGAQAVDDGGGDGDGGDGAPGVW